MLRKGSKSMTSLQIDEKLDFYGAEMSISDGYEELRISFSCLKSTFVELLPFLYEVVFEATFSEKEFENLIKLRVGKIKQTLANADDVADRRLGEIFIGADNPYGYATDFKDLDAIKVEDIVAFYGLKYKPNLAKYYLAGDIQEEHSDAVNAIFNPQKVDFFTENFEFKFALPEQKMYKIPFEDKLQHAIKIGFPSIGPTHPEFNDLMIVQMLLGGFFGSRLMSNIREDKGYTYGIYSTLFTEKYCTYAMISTEVGKEYLDDTLVQIKAEIDRIQTENAKPKELNILKKYLLGDIMRSNTGAFKLADIHYKSSKFGLPENNLEILLQRIEEITAEEIKKCAQKFVNFDNFYIVVV
jgi:zinc protease